MFDQFTGATVTFQGAEARSGTFGTIRDSSNNEASLTVNAGVWTQLPSAVLGVHSLKIVSASDEAAARSLIVCLK